MTEQAAARLGSPLNLLLIGLSGVSMFVHDYRKWAAPFISRIMVLSLTLATWQETRGGQAVAALRTMVHSTVAIRRRRANGQRGPLGRSVLSPGSFPVTLSTAAGDLVPDDVRLLASQELFANPATLTDDCW